MAHIQWLTSLLMTGEEDREELWSNKHAIDKDYVAKGTGQLYFTDILSLCIGGIRMEVSGMCSCDMRHTQSDVHSIWLGELVCLS